MTVPFTVDDVENWYKMEVDAQKDVDSKIKIYYYIIDKNH